MSRLISNRRTVAEKRGGGGITITLFATISDLMIASAAGLPAGLYRAETTGPTIYTWDETSFDVVLSPVMDLSDVVAWWRAGKKAKLGGAVATTVGDSVSTWNGSAPGSELSRLVSSGATLGLIGTREAVQVGNTMSTSAHNPAINTDESFEIFSVIKLSDNIQVNKGIASSWNSATGWLLMAADFNAPNGVLFGVTSTYIRAGSRLGTDPHLVHGRYDGTTMTLSIDGVDVASRPKTGPSTVNSNVPLTVGGYAESNTMNGLISDVVLINRLLTTGERALIVADLMAGI